MSKRKRFIAYVVLITCGAAALFILLFSSNSGQTSDKESSDSKLTSSTPSDSNGSSSAKSSPSEQETAPVYGQQLLPYDISKNPYKWSGQYGILDTMHTPVVLPTGGVIEGQYTLGGISFNKMLDRNLAIFDIRVIDQSLTTDGQLAVVLPDNEPPDARRPWKVAVLDPIQGTNAFGATLQVAAVRFDGYDTELPPQAGPTHPSELSESVGVQTAPPVGKADSTQVTQQPVLTTQPNEQLQTPAPIERRDPPNR